MWTRHSKREEVLRHVSALVNTFIEGHPARLTVFILIEPTGPLLANGSPSFFEFTRSTPKVVAEALARREAPFDTPSRTASITEIMGRYTTNEKAGHTFLYEPSSECILHGKRTTCTYFTALLYDSADRIYGMIFLLSPHASPQPVVKPVIINTFCHTCSKKPEGLEVLVGQEYSAITSSSFTSSSGPFSSTAPHSPFNSFFPLPPNDTDSYFAQQFPAYFLTND
ncbi:MAG: hypothetical protein Q8P67_08785 [archaeon]|nr:hypothetical protein [archaeon]